MNHDVAMAENRLQLLVADIVQIFSLNTEDVAVRMSGRKGTIAAIRTQMAWDNVFPAIVILE